jgi:hypothetical protein
MKAYRVSNVEQFRQWENDDEYEVETLLSRLYGLEEPSEAMQAGTAFHKCLELSQSGLNADRMEHDGYVFTFEGDFTLALPEIRELRAHKVFVVDGEPIAITGQVDGIEGKRIDDHKTTGSFSPDRYLEGYQWRLYLSIFGADMFRWNVFEIANLADDPPKQYRVRNHHTLEQFRYPGMEGDCQALVERFARFVRGHMKQAA